MAHIILSNNNKELKRVIAFPAIYTQALGKMRPEVICELKLNKLDDDKTTVIKEIL